MTRVKDGSGRTMFHVVMFGSLPDDTPLLLVGASEHFTCDSRPVLFANYGESGTFVRVGGVFDPKMFQEVRTRWHRFRELTVGVENALLCTTNNGSSVEQWSYNLAPITPTRHEQTWGFTYDKDSGVIQQRSL